MHGERRSTSSGSWREEERSGGVRVAEFVSITGETGAGGEGSGSSGSDASDVVRRRFARVRVGGGNGASGVNLRRFEVVSGRSGVCSLRFILGGGRKMEEAKMK